MDHNYWSSYYQDSDAPNAPSDFATHCSTLPQKMVIDIGCGNFRDSNYFSDLGKTVLAVDQVEAPAKARDVLFHRHKFGTDDLSLLMNRAEVLLGSEDTIVFARFFLHSLEGLEMIDFLKFCSFAASRGALICIETRAPVETSLDIPIKKNHRRNLIPDNELEELFLSYGLVVARKDSGRGLAKFGKEDPLVYRFFLKEG